MDYHGITSKGKIFIQRVSTLPIWTLLDIARLIYTNDSGKFYIAGSEEWKEIIDGVSDQTIVGVKTFTSPPMITRDPSAGDEAVRLSYLQDNYIEGDIDLSDYVTKSTPQVISALKAFDSVLPQSDITPTNNDDLTNKLYVDTVAPKMLVSSVDSTLGYLWDKIQGGDGILLSKMGADGANQSIKISISSFSGGNFYSDLPVGTIIKYAGSSPPAGYIECDGSAVSRTTYSELFNVIGEDYGIGNGTTTFNIPSCSGDNCSGEMWCIKYDESEAVNGIDEKVKVSSDDTTASYLEQKIVAGSGISITTTSPGGNEQYVISSAAGASSTGLWLKSTSGGNNCTIKAGSVVINNVIYSLSTDLAATLSGYLRSGESELPNTFYYLYAIGGSGSVPTFQFSSHKPTKNKYGNTVSFEEECGRSELYHPIEGLTWRYIGEVYNNSSSNIIAFAKMYPGYWESGWITNPLTYLLYGDGYYVNMGMDVYVSTTLNHGLAILPNKFNALYSKTNSNITTKYPWISMVSTFAVGPLNEMSGYYDLSTSVWGYINHTINSNNIGVKVTQSFDYYYTNPYYEETLRYGHYVRGYINYILEI